MRDKYTYNHPEGIQSVDHLNEIREKKGKPPKTSLQIIDGADGTNNKWTNAAKTVRVFGKGIEYAGNGLSILGAGLQGYEIGTGFDEILHQEKIGEGFLKISSNTAQLATEVVVIEASAGAGFGGAVVASGAAVATIGSIFLLENSIRKSFIENRPEEAITMIALDTYQEQGLIPVWKEFGQEVWNRFSGDDLTATVYQVDSDATALTVSQLNDFVVRSAEIFVDNFEQNYPLKLIFDIADLPNDVLGRNIPLKLSKDGIPISSRILIDSNAAGLGWFVNPASDNSVDFSEKLSVNAYQANQNSDASEQYDLQTVLLHELGHALGFYSENENLANFTEIVEGTPTFIGGDFTVTLTPDGSHIDDTAHPHQLMNAYLAPGIRRLPGELDIKILQAIRGTVSPETTLQAPFSAVEPLGNVAPIITTLSGDTNIGQEESVTFTATASDANNDTLTYTWDFGDGSQPITAGPTANYTYATDGTYITTLTVADPHGATTSATFDPITVDTSSVASAINQPSTDLRQSVFEIWNNQLQSEIPFAVDLAIEDLATGRLSEALVTQFDQHGRPIGGTILIDDDANGLGWFIDPTPSDHSEFATQTSAFGYQATTSSPAHNQYDLFTTLLHEVGHIAGFIHGWHGYDDHIQTIDGTPTFTTDDFTAQLSPDLSHLGTGSSLMSTTLRPGVRLLPSDLEIQLLNAARSLDDHDHDHDLASNLTAPLTAGPLLGINNGDFVITDPADPNFVWNTRGNVTLLSEQAVLSEDSPLLTNLTQTFTVPAGAQTLQFTLINSELHNSNLAPGDAFEVALLDAETQLPLLETATGLSQTDAFFSLQADGQTFFGSQVALPAALTSGEILTLDNGITVNIDVSNIAPDTTATLYFDLLGFGERDASVIIDNVLLFSDELIPPTANNDTATTLPDTPVTLNVLTNDNDFDGTLDPTSLTLATQPEHGSVTLNDDGTLTYTPEADFLGTDSFTYTIQDNDQQTSNPATVTIAVTDPTPTITNLTGDTSLNEGDSAQFTATATDPAERALTYTWNFGDGTDPSTGENPTHTFADDGTYTVTLTVANEDGISTQQTLTVEVSNVTPQVDLGPDLTFNEGEPITLLGSFTDPGIEDTHTIEWSSGDETLATEGLELQPNVTNPGQHTVTLSVTDDDGATGSDTVVITINNVAPTITELNGSTTLNEGEPTTFSAAATDPGNDILIYSWNFGDGSDPATGQTVDHTFADNGTYSVELTVTDAAGGTATEALTVEVTNVAPTVETGADQSVSEGSEVTFNGSFTDPGILDTHTVEWNLGDGTTLTDTLNPTHLYSENGTYTVTFSVTDKDGGVAQDSLTVTVNNINPTITELNGRTTLDEGETTTFSATATDSSNDALTYSWDFGDGTNPAIGQTVDHTFADNGTYTITLTVTDEDSGSTTEALTVEVVNVAPTVDAGLDQATNGGEELSFNGSFADPGILDTHTIEWNFGDGTSIIDTLNPTHTYQQEGSYTVELTVTDKDGGTTTDTLSVSITVDNLNPIITELNGQATLNEGQETTFSASAIDPDSNEILTYTWEFGDGSDPVTGTSVAHTFADNGQYNVTLTVTDAEGGIATEILTVDVSNLAPMVEAGLDRSVSEGHEITFNGSFADPGILDTHTIEWDFGDGTTLSDVLNPTHQYEQPGAYTATLLVTDKDGASHQDTVTITVTPVMAELPSLLISDAILSETSEGIMLATFEVTLSSTSEQPISVNFNTADGTATQGMDYTPTSGTLSFEPGQTKQMIQIPILKPKEGDIDGDGDVDRDDMALLLAARNQPAQPLATGTETFSLLLSNPQGASLLDDLGLSTISSGGYDPRDLDRDGIITVLDARKLAILIRAQ